MSNASPQPTAVPAGRPGLTPLQPPARFSPERVLGMVLLIGVVTLGWFTRDYWVPNALLYSQRSAPPDGFTWLKLGTSRLELLQQLSASGATWANIAKPGMAPTAWTAHVAGTSQGLSSRDFAVIYSDGRQYNYRAIPAQGDGPINVEALAPPGSADARVVAIRWRLPRSFTETNSAVPASAAMRELGLPHAEEKDIVGTGRIYKWNWPGVQASYITLQGVVTLESVEGLSHVDVHGGPGNLSQTGPPPAESAGSGAGSEKPANAAEATSRSTTPSPPATTPDPAGEHSGAAESPPDE